MPVLRRVSALLALLAFASLAQAQITIEVESVEGVATGPDPVLSDPQVSFGQCLGWSYAGVGLEVTFGENAGARWNFDVIGFSSDLVDAVSGDLGPPSVVPSPCGTIIALDYGTIQGNVDLTSLSFGIDLQVIRRAGAKMQWTDVLEVTSPTAQAVEFRFDIEGSLIAAEGAGSPADTYGRVSMQLSGSVGGQPVGPHMAAVESVTVIPEQASIDEEVVIVVPVGPGTTLVPVDVMGMAQVEVAARCAGLGCSVIGGSTAAATFTRGIAFRCIDPPPDVTIRGQDGDRYPVCGETAKPLPPGVVPLFSNPWLGRLLLAAALILGATRVRAFRSTR